MYIISCKRQQARDQSAVGSRQSAVAVGSRQSAVGSTSRQSVKIVADCQLHIVDFLLLSGI